MQCECCVSGWKQPGADLQELLSASPARSACAQRGSSTHWLPSRLMVVKYWAKRSLAGSTPTTLRLDRLLQDRARVQGGEGARRVAAGHGRN